MTWLVWLALAAIIAAVAAVTGMQPTGARPVASTRLMGIARLVLVALIIIFVYFAWRARTGV